MATPPRAVLQSLDPNNVSISVTDAKTPGKTPRKTPCGTTPAASRTPGGGTAGTPGRTPKGKLPSPFPIQQRRFETPHNKRKEKFDLVCKERVGEDIDGDLCDLGIQEWAVDDFVYVRKLGRGGAATVYLAQEKQSRYPVALKIQEADENAICEIDVHLPLQHPNVVRMVDYFYSFRSFGPIDEEQEDECNDSHLSQKPEYDPSKPYLYMILEVCDGGSLHDVIDATTGCALSEAQAAKYFMGCLKAMEYVHSQNLIHCDCKPANFLVHDNCVKLADFGMAVRDTEREVVGGSPVYMAPEHLMAWRHMTENFDHRSDIYSLGVVLYEMLVGYLPYEVIEADETISRASMSNYEDLNALTAVEGEVDESADLFPVLDLRKLNDHLSDEPFYMPPPIFLDEVSEEAEDLVMCLMEPSPQHRITIAEAMAHPWFKQFQM